MEAMQRATWTDGRLDDLNRRVERGFREVNAELRALRSEINGRFESVEGRFDALQQSMIQVGCGMIATFIGGFVGLLLTHA
jgi:hypothetical protein